MSFIPYPGSSQIQIEPLQFLSVSLSLPLFLSQNYSDFYTFKHVNNQTPHILYLLVFLYAFLFIFPASEPAAVLP
jgi:hypothetical protein